VRNHFPWVEAAHLLGCHAIRVTPKHTQGTPEAQQDRVAESLSALARFAADYRLKILVKTTAASRPTRLVVGVMRRSTCPLRHLAGFRELHRERRQALRRYRVWRMMLGRRRQREVL